MMATLPSISIVVRTLNERPAFERLLASLARQTITDYELIVVDNESSDGTAEAAAAAGARIVTLPRDTFTFPLSMNLGCAAATAPLIFLTVGHAVFLHDDAIARAIAHFDDTRVAGVFGPSVPPHDAPLAERATLGVLERLARLRGVARIRRYGMGVMGATSCVIRAALWSEHPFDASFERGGEDGEWARWALANGHTILRDPALAVEHSHSLTFPRLVRQLIAWRRMARPSTMRESSS